MTLNFTCDRVGLPSAAVSVTDPYAFVSSLGAIADSLRLRVGGSVAVQRTGELAVASAGGGGGADAHP